MGQSVLTQPCYQVSLACAGAKAKAMQHTDTVLLHCSLFDTTSLHYYSSPMICMMRQHVSVEISSLALSFFVRAAGHPRRFQRFYLTVF